jgi:hypothetical protein
MQYLLDLETLLLFLGSRRQSGELFTDLKRFPGIAHKGPYRVHITLIEGKVVACSVQDLTGRELVSGNSAIRGLEKLGQLDWAWSAANPRPLPALAQPPAPLQRSPAIPAPGNLSNGPALVPRRIVPLEMINKNVLPRKYWQILLLVDGSRTVVHIANLLWVSPSPSDIQEVIAILTDLQRRRLVVITQN